MDGQAQSALDANTVALISIIAVFVSGTLATVLSRFGTKKSEDAKRLDTIIEGLEGDVASKRQDVAELRAVIREKDQEIAGLKADIRMLEGAKRQEFMDAVKALFPEPKPLDPPT